MRLSICVLGTSLTLANTSLNNPLCCLRIADEIHGASSVLDSFTQLMAVATCIFPMIFNHCSVEGLYSDSRHLIKVVESLMRMAFLKRISIIFALDFSRTIRWRSCSGVGPFGVTLICIVVFCCVDIPELCVPTTVFPMMVGSSLCLLIIVGSMMSGGSRVTFMYH